MTIHIVGVPYSDNLGDGIIADCLRAKLRRLRGGAEVQVIDLAGRHGYGDVSVRGKQGILALLNRLPTWARRLVAVPGILAVVLRRPFWGWLKALRPGDRVVIGGGQLLQDQDLNFPLKILLFGIAARVKGCRVGIFSVGVSREWSTPGRLMFQAAFRLMKLRHAAVRDPGSQESLHRHGVVGRLPVNLALDPGLFAAETYQAVVGTAKGVGVNLADPRELRHQNRFMSAQTDIYGQHIETWGKVIRELVDQGTQVILFTNGAREDEAYLADLIARLNLRQGEGVTVLPRPKTPEMLVGHIKGLDFLMAHRLHANIVAYSLGVPSLGLGWDDKLEAFYRVSGQSKFFLKAEDFTPAGILSGYKLRQASPALEGRSAVLAGFDEAAQRLLADLDA